MIKVLVVEDSTVAREYISYLIDREPGMRVIGAACNGAEAVEYVKREKPDVITMDINMPVMDGLTATRRIMEIAPTPIIIVTASWDVREVQTTFRAIDAGALIAIEKPGGINHPGYEKNVIELLNTIRLMSEVKVVKRWRWKDRGEEPVPSPAVQPRRDGIKIVAIGASTGGPAAIKTILSGLPDHVSVPIVIVQHMSPGFIGGFISWLDADTHYDVRAAAQSEIVTPQTAYVAPDGVHLGVGTDGRIELTNGAPENNVCPSVSFLFRSVAASYGRKSAAVLLSGMGMDGARELKLLKEKGAVTIAQNKESSIVFGMPGEAVRLNAAAHVLSPEGIVTVLGKLQE